jgi:hypothetical protein
VFKELNLNFKLSQIFWNYGHLVGVFSGTSAGQNGTQSGGMTNFKARMSKEFPKFKCSIHEGQESASADMKGRTTGRGEGADITEGEAGTNCPTRIGVFNRVLIVAIGGGWQKDFVQSRRKTLLM